MARAPRSTVARARGGTLRSTAGLLAAVVVLLVATTSATASTATLTNTVIAGPTVAVRPGPDILYAPPAYAPQLQNVLPWAAEPILVSGSSAYRAGEFLYQDYLYDDRGANGSRTYPADPDLAGNGADFVEFRIKPEGAAIAVRITYNSLINPELVATTIALGDSAQARAMPHGANTVTPAQVFVTVHGATGDIVDAATGQTMDERPAVTVDLTRRQVDIRIPHTAFDPGSAVTRVSAATGVWDGASGGYLAADSETSAFFNVAFRFGENGIWNDNRQQAALAAGDLTPFHALVDFDKLHNRIDDDLAGHLEGVPQQGYLQRIVASHFETQQGRGSSYLTCEQPCQLTPEYAGQLQPYSVYVPSGKPSPYGLVYQPHWAGGTYMGWDVLREGQVSGRGDPPEQNLIGETTNSVVFVPHGRGTTQWYWGQSAADVFEVAADLMRLYPIDTERVAIHGTSMGGYGTYKLAAQWPDLFSAAATIVGCVSAETFWPGSPVPPLSGEATKIESLAPSLRNVPLLSLNGAADTTCTSSSQHQLLAALDGLGYRYEWRDYPGDHWAAIFEVSAFAPNLVAEFLAGGQAVPDPAHVTYVHNAKASQTDYGLNADHAYWVSGLALGTAVGAAPRGTIDVFSHGFGVGDPPSLGSEPQSGDGYVGSRNQWGPAPAAVIQNVLDIDADNIAAVTIDVRRAKVGCDVTVNITSNTPITVTLAGCADQP